ncbi:MAG: S49 family peptidase [Pseudomonadota bacterium]
MSVAENLKSAAFSLYERLLPGSAKVPVVRLEGMIAAGGRGGGQTLSLQRVEKLLERAFSMNDAPAVALLINSPGGSPVQSRLIYRRIRALAEANKKTVLVFCEDAAASGGYMLACAGDEIFCDGSSILGSIGVVSSGFGFTDVMKKVGVERRLKTAGADKVLADPFGPETKEQSERLESIMAKMHEQFIDIVRTRRSEKLAEDADLFTGAVFIGTDAVANGLADGEADLKAELQERYGEDVRIKMLAPKRAGALSRFVGSTSEVLADTLESRGLWARLGL